MGTRLNNCTLAVHYEKTLSQVKGAYQVLNQMVALKLQGKYTFVNRENDTDNPGLRQAKRSYQPDHLAAAYILTCTCL